MKFQICNFQTDFIDWCLRYLLWNCPNMNFTGLHWWAVNIGAVRQQAITWANVDSDHSRHMASLGHNEFCSRSLYWGLVDQGWGYLGFFNIKINHDLVGQSMQPLIKWTHGEYHMFHLVHRASPVIPSWSIPSQMWAKWDINLSGKPRECWECQLL